ncbi:VIR protein [Plasmodium vivax]|uniref:VIR protein n=1 Tax=Plasmodium vivax TaxID=5855 RepID=A0A1G4EE54_PLAVI|nr:VIR protein [Plasmodium vivax]
MYDTLDKDVSNEDGNQDILSSCDRENAFNANPTIEEKNTCKKLLRNLFSCNDPNSVKFMKCCSDLYIWLYFEIKKYSLSNDIIKNIFKLTNLRKDQVPKPKYCDYFSFNDNLHKPEELIKLRIFNDNIDKFQNLLINTDYSKNCFFKRYFYECVNTYIDLNGQFCSEDKKDISSNKDTCKILRDFSFLYTTFRQMANSKGYELPDLYSSKPYHVVSCTSEVTNLESSSTDSNNSDKSIQRSVPTAIGTMAAIPPFLALIYRFTPVGTMFRSKNKKSVNVFNHLDEEIEKDLFYPRSKNGIMNSSNERYSVAYEPV